MRSHQRKRDANVTRDGDPEGCSSEKTAMVMADGFEVPAGNTDPSARGEEGSAPRSFSPRRALHYVYTGTRETR